MKSRLRTLLAAGACLAVIGGSATFASANTELVPGSRLVVPYFDTTSGRNTFLFLTNASVFGATFPVAYTNHLEFYSTTCNRQNTVDTLSVGDIDQIDVAAISLGFTQGWVDIDIRATPPGVVGRTSPSFQVNALMGTVLISDVAGGFAFAYPAASYQGLSVFGPLGVIVTRVGTGTASAWFGGYEPAPWDVYVPVYLAEGGPLGAQAFVALAAPADGNWDFSANGEAPGQEIGKGSAGPLMNLSALVYDGCENNVSRNWTAHYVFTKLDTPATLNTPHQPWNPLVLPGTCGIAFPMIDEFSGASAGWIDIVNAAVSCDNSTPGALPGQCIGYPPGSIFPIAKFPGIGVGQRRGMIGLFLENTTVAPSGAGNQGEATRIWGNPAPWSGISGVVCGTGLSGGFPTVAMGFGGAFAPGCQYSLVDFVSHPELALP